VLDCGDLVSIEADAGAKIGFHDILITCLHRGRDPRVSPDESDPVIGGSRLDGEIDFLS
jgi:hypothetical protein